MIRAIRLLVLLLFFKNVAHGKQNLNQECILGNAEPGRCIRSNECSEIAELFAKPTLYPQDMEKLLAAARACGSDLNSADAIVCCEPSQLPRPTTTTPAPPTRKSTPEPTQRPTTSRVTTSLPIIFTYTSTNPSTKPTSTRGTTPRPTPRPVPTPLPFRIPSRSTNPPRPILPASCGLLPPSELTYPGILDEGNIHVWAVFLEIQRSNYTGRCVGTLIHERFVLTAAHCVHTSRRKDFKLYFGLISYSERNECVAIGDGICQKRRAAELIVHPNYNSHSQLNDVALIKLVRAVNITDHVRPACLPMDYLFDEDLKSDTRVIAVGWGEYEGGERSDSKRVVQLVVIEKDECKVQLGKWKRFNMSMIDRVICTRGAQEGHDVCDGDSGAPMLEYRQKRYHVVGVVSFGPKCGTGSDKAGVSMRLSEYINWILTKL